MATNIERLAVRLARKEGKKSQVKMGDAREVIALLSDFVYKGAWLDTKGGVHSSVARTLFLNGRRRATTKK